MTFLPTVRIFIIHRTLLLFVPFSLAVPEPVAFYPLDVTFTTNDVQTRPQLKGRASNVVFTTGPQGAKQGAYEFSGNNNSYIEFPNGNGILDVQNSITLMCWVRPGGQDGPLFNYKKTGDFGVHIWIEGNGKFFNRITKSGSYAHLDPLRTNQSLEVGKWVHVAATYNSYTGVNSIYVDGVLNKTQNVEKGVRIATNDPAVRMGVKIGDSRYFKGAITKMMVYDVALRAEQILAVRNQGNF